MTENTKTTKTGLSLLSDSENKTLDINLQLLQLREIGVRVTMQGIAESHAKRLAKLSAIAMKLEDELFDEDLIDNLTDSDKVERYQLVINSINNHSNAIKSTLGNIDWASMEIKLQSLNNRESLDMTEGVSDQKNLSQLASQLLSELSSINVS